MKTNTMPRGMTSPNMSMLGLYKKTKHWKMSDILRAKKMALKTTETARTFRANLKQRETKKATGMRVGLVKKLKAGYNITGFGQTNTTVFDCVHYIAQVAGFTHLKLGGNIFAVSPKPFIG